MKKILLSILSVLMLMSGCTAKQEVKEEYKQMEGDPQIKGKIKRECVIIRRIRKEVRSCLKQIMKEIHARIGFLRSVGLEYLSLSRATGTLSGGEAQRIRLASQIGAGLVGVLYILDEPTTGLHFEDIRRLIEVLNKLVDKGNTVIVIEHNLDVIKSADYIIDMGPEGGQGGGKVVAVGTPEEVAKNPNSVTGEYLKRLLKK